MQEHPYQTKIISIDPQNIDDRLLMPAAEALRRGELVAFPTETVYGLGANALDATAVNRIYAAKGRPADNPLIVHLADLAGLPELVGQITPLAQKLFAAFSPGPLTLILPRSSRIPDQVTAGLDTVAIRLPSHPVARRLIELAGVPVAAPSANRSGRPSPTRAWHVREDLDGLIPYIIDGGDCRFGLESTVVDATGRIPAILRPGSITAAAIRSVAGSVAGIGSEDGGHAGKPHGGRPEQSGMAPNGTPRAPGMKYRHYAPKARVVLAESPELAARQSLLRQLLETWSAQSCKIGVFGCRQLIEALPVRGLEITAGESAARIKQAADTAADFYYLAYAIEPDPAAAGKALFNALRLLDEVGVAVILAEGLPDGGLGSAYMNRLRKAAGTPADLPPEGT